MKKNLLNLLLFCSLMIYGNQVSAVDAKTQEQVKPRIIQCLQNIQSGNYTEALQISNDITTRYPDVDAGYFLKGLVFEAQKKYSAAIQEYSNAIQINPNLSDAYLHRASVYTNVNRFQEAIRDLDLVISATPNNYLAYYLRGQAKYLSKDYKEALADYDKSLKINPDYKPAQEGSLAAQMKSYKW